MYLLYVYIYIYIYVCVCVCVKNCKTLSGFATNINFYTAKLLSVMQLLKFYIFFNIIVNIMGSHTT